MKHKLPREKESRIVAAAVNHGGKIWTGKRHAEIMGEIWAKEGSTQTYISQDAQGFITDDGEFVNRFQAGAIAFRSGQTATRKERLLSEHLW